MRIDVRLFARARELAGAATLSIEVAEPASVGDLRRRIGLDHPTLAALLPRCAVAVDGEFATDEVLVTSNAEIAVLPPVSGG
jgi:molybdopterin synthase catalytic subunit